ncbi:MAG: hypothetical protein S0880_03240 [Actinomycetota bacterium]|nr:hypothetical protein [Actinomycetota bacterium]
MSGPQGPDRAGSTLLGRRLESFVGQHGIKVLAVVASAVMIAAIPALIAASEGDDSGGLVSTTDDPDRADDVPAGDVPIARPETGGGSPSPLAVAPPPTAPPTSAAPVVASPPPSPPATELLVPATAPTTTPPTTAPPTTPPTTTAPPTTAPPTTPPTSSVPPATVPPTTAPPATAPPASQPPQNGNGDGNDGRRGGRDLREELRERIGQFADGARERFEDRRGRGDRNNDRGRGGRNDDRGRGGRDDGWGRGDRGGRRG